MKRTTTFHQLLLVLCLFVFAIMSSCEGPGPTTDEALTKQLRHVVLFKFKADADPAAIKRAEDAFVALPAKIPEIKDFEWGLNNSPEGLEKGFTHCYFLTFASEEDRAVYLPHPDHKAFGKLLDGILDDVLVVDYWAE
jgi:hypothetical protein